MLYALCALLFWWHKKCLILSQRFISGIVDATLQRVEVILKDIQDRILPSRDGLFYLKERSDRKPRVTVHDFALGFMH